VRDPELVSTLAEIGVILLLFEIGIEFSLAKLARLKRAIGLGGGLQADGTVALVTGIGLWAGVDLGPSLYTGFLVALSSTAVVLGLLASRGETDTPAGPVFLAVLIFQDHPFQGVLKCPPFRPPDARNVRFAPGSGLSIRRFRMRSGRPAVRAVGTEEYNT
jgi:predicted Kef-type K+ transport protein